MADVLLSVPTVPEEAPGASPVPASSSVPSSNLLGSLYRMKVDQYERIVESGELDDLNIELIHGWLVRKMSKNRSHTISAGRLVRELNAIVPQGWHIEMEQPVRVPEFDEPEPDAAVVAGALEDHAVPPGPPDLALVAEVSSSSLERDRGEKRAAYAHGAVPYYWIVNLVDRRIEVYSRPLDGRYQELQSFGAGDEVPVVVAGHEAGRIAVDRILPPVKPS